MRFSISMPRWAAAPLGLALLACGGDGTTEPPTEPPPPAAIVMVSGDDQEGKAGEPLPEPFVVRVTDAGGEGVGGVWVTWSVTSGAGEFLQTVVLRTHRDGTLRVFFRPTVLGTSAVAAEVDGLEGSPVTFTADATALVIALNGDPIDGSWFAGPEGLSDIAVPVGTRVEWVYRAPCCGLTARVVSTSAPPGGESFDSGNLSQNGERFEFVPGVAGTWEFLDQVSGATGTLTAE